MDQMQGNLVSLYKRKTILIIVAFSIISFLFACSSLKEVEENNSLSIIQENEKLMEERYIESLEQNQTLIIQE